MKVAFLIFLLPGLFAAEVLIATIAQVKNQVITTRDVQIHVTLAKASGAGDQIYQEKDPVEQLIRQWLLYFEANSFYSAPLPASQVNEEVARLSKELKSLKGWKILQVGPAELREIVRRKMEADRLYTFKKEASKLPVSDSEVETEYKQNRIRYGTFSIKEVREKIRQRKVQENLSERLNNWFEVLERKYRVQRFAKYNRRE